MIIVRLAKLKCQQSGCYTVVSIVSFQNIKKWKHILKGTLARKMEETVKNFICPIVVLDYPNYSTLSFHVGENGLN